MQNIFSDYDRMMMEECSLSIECAADITETLFTEYTLWQDPAKTPVFLRETTKGFLEGFMKDYAGIYDSLAESGGNSMMDNPREKYPHISFS